ncbi:MAG: 23S rRNA (adenine(2503)-C(2))-methyltransferase RlmN [Deltaproteobacteria bacterium]|nr:23S rRNA (adenine(2503)-C(2))-methyltransferase RlmN [Deltaproteobacteria bacterium]
MESTRQDIKSLSIEELSAWLQEHSCKSYRARQISSWIYLRQADGFSDMTNLSKTLRHELSESFTMPRLKILKTKSSSDGTKKYLFRLKDGEHIETVLIPEKDHFTLCVSTQVGCAQGCQFCLTAKNGFTRDLTKAEIISQVRDIVNELNESKPLTNIVFMGMGEPLANYDNLIRAIDVISNSDFGLKFSTRRITVSTAGIVPRFSDLGRDAQVNLEVSLNATDNTTRSMLMPINRKYSIEQLLEACRNFPLKPRRRITFEYILIQGINDSPDDAKRLSRLLRSIKAKINLIPFNEHGDCKFKRPEDADIFRFQKILLDNDYTVNIRYSKGLDISAACGQLRAQHAEQLTPIAT